MHAESGLDVTGVGDAPDAQRHDRPTPLSSVVLVFVNDMDGSLPHLLHYELDDDEPRRREKLLHALKSCSGYWSARRAVKEAALSLPFATLADELPRVLSSSSVSWRLRNLIHLADRDASERLNDISAGDGTAHEPLEIVEAARKQWDARLRYQLRAAATEHKRSLAERRSRHGWYFQTLNNPKQP